MSDDSIESSGAPVARRVSAPTDFARSESTMGSAPEEVDERPVPVSPEPRKSGPRVTSVELPEILTPDELGDLLRVDRKTIYTLIQRGDLPGVRRLGRTIRIHSDAVRTWLAQGQGRVSRSRRLS